jgi:hypothetical protein
MIDFIRENGEKINEEIRKAYENLLYNWKKDYVYDVIDFNYQLALCKKSGRHNEWWKNEDFQTIMQNENNENNENIKHKEKKKIKEKKIKFFKISEDNDNDEDDNKDSNIFGFKKFKILKK